MGAAPAVVHARPKNARAAAVSRFADMYTSMTCPYSSTARCTYRQAPPTFTYVSSVNHRLPTGRRDGRAASANSGVNRCTQR